MHKIDASGHVANEFSDGNPLTGQEATMVDAAFANAVMYELVNVILHAGIALSKGTNTQLRDAIIAIATGGGEAVTAEGVSIADAGNFFGAIENVEGALQFLAEIVAQGTYAASRFRRQIVQLSGAAHNLQAGHFENVVEISHSSAVTYTVLTDAGVSSPIGTTITVFQEGAGQIEFIAAGGVTIKKGASFVAKTMEQHAPAVLVKTAANTWRLGGTLAAAA